MTTIAQYLNVTDRQTETTWRIAIRRFALRTWHSKKAKRTKNVPLSSLDWTLPPVRNFGYPLHGLQGEWLYVYARKRPI